MQTELRCRVGDLAAVCRPPEGNPDLLGTLVLVTGEAVGLDKLLGSDWVVERASGRPITLYGEWHLFAFAPDAFLRPIRMPSADELQRLADLDIEL